MFETLCLIGHWLRWIKRIDRSNWSKWFRAWWNTASGKSGPSAAAAGYKSPSVQHTMNMKCFQVAMHHESWKMEVHLLDLLYEVIIICDVLYDYRSVLLIHSQVCIFLQRIILSQLFSSLNTCSVYLAETYICGALELIHNLSKFVLIHQASAVHLEGPNWVYCIVMNPFGR